MPTSVEIISAYGLKREVAKDERKHADHSAHTAAGKLYIKVCVIGNLIEMMFPMVHGVWHW